MGFTNRAHIKKLIFRTLSKYLVYRISMNIFSEEPFLSPTRLYGQYPPSQSYLQNKASWLIPLESTCGVLSLLPAHPSSAPTSKSWTSPQRGGRSFSFPLFFIRLRLYVAGEELPRASLPFSRPFFMETAWELCISMRTSLRLTQRFSGPLYVNEKMERKRMIRLWSDRAYRRKKKLGGGNPKGGGRGRNSRRGLRLAWGLGRDGLWWGWASGKTKGRPG